MSPTATPAAPYLLGYITNGFYHHRLLDALALIAECGYRAVGLSPDVHHLPPGSATPERVAAVARRLEALELVPVMETGARYILDPRRKHQPTLLSDDPAPRLDFLEACCRIGRDLGARVLSFWSGAPEPGQPMALAWERLVRGIAQLLERVDGHGLRLAFEPEPGMLVADMTGYARLRREFGEALGLTLDVGHVHLTETEPIPEVIRRWSGSLANIHIEDMRRPHHEHLAFGAGEIDPGPVLAAIAACGYRGAVLVELSRDGHRAPQMAREAMATLTRSQRQRDG